MPPPEGRTRKVRPPWGIQTFLNDPHHPDRGYFKGRIVWEHWTPSPTIDLTIADCQRVITLDFEPDSLSKKDKAARIRKLRRLQKFVNAFVERAIAAIESAEPFPREEADKK